MTPPFPAPRSIVITGASSGLGEALAMAYAAPGVALALTGRDRGRLGEVTGRCLAAGAEVTAEAVDVTDRKAMADWLGAIDRARPVDLVIANAGISAGTGGRGEGEVQVRHIFSVNLDGVLNTVWPLVTAMQARRRGQIALMASLAGFRGFPGAPAYCASKAAVRLYGEALRGQLWADGIRVSVICPGYVETRMTAHNAFPMPFLMPAERAAAIIVRGLAHGRSRIAFPWPTSFAAWLLGVLPPVWTDRALRALPRKE